MEYVNINLIKNRPKNTNSSELTKFKSPESKASKIECLAIALVLISLLYYNKSHETNTKANNQPNDYQQAERLNK